MFASLGGLSVLSFVPRTFDWGGENGLGWGGRCRAWKKLHTK